MKRASAPKDKTPGHGNGCTASADLWSTDRILNAKSVGLPEAVVSIGYWLARTFDVVVSCIYMPVIKFRRILLEC